MPDFPDGAVASSFPEKGDSGTEDCHPFLDCRDYLGGAYDSDFKNKIEY